ncbi:MAG: GNAT family N-acetyltransferase, partial [Armatimonadota bacterium]|nr:GNAT family N-acetyltransferase [Armatimonadota bacterium]
MSDDPSRRLSGRGGIALRPMTINDIADGMHLKAIAGWNQTEDDWRLFLQTNPDGCFVAVRNGRTVGTVATINYGHALAWIGMVLVAPQFRRMGIGTLLLEQAISYLEHLEPRPLILLDATPTGKELYDTLGFHE